MDVLLVVAILGFGAVLVAAIALQRRQPAPPPADVAAPLQQIAAAVQAIQVQASVLAERANATAERVSAVEHRQVAMQESVSGLQANLARAGEMTTGLQQAAEAIRGELTQARAGLSALQEHATARQDMERQAAESLRRLEQVIAGTAARGAAGENLVDLVFSRLPAEWQLRDFRLGNRVVEFALRLPNNLVLPIDSKWPAPDLIERFTASDDPAERARLKTQVESAVLERAREVTKYLDPELTLNFGVAVVPDAVFDLCGGVQGQCVRMNVVLVAHSMFVPYLLLVFQTVLRTSRDIDLEKLAAYLHAAEQGLDAIQGEIEGRLSRTVTQLANSRDALRTQVAQVGSGLAAMQLRAAPVELALPSSAPRAMPGGDAGE